MAASFALGGVGLAGCRRPEKFILPYGKSVEGVIPGLPAYYATAMPVRKWALPLLAETHQGRPTKVEGNPSYAPHGGAASLAAQASILDLYDPDRATAHTKGSAILNREDRGDVHGFPRGRIGVFSGGIFVAHSAAISGCVAGEVSPRGLVGVRTGGG
jgi:molybdopterin-containing oxidoreductase family iron-sulfur binding subunit